MLPLALTLVAGLTAPAQAQTPHRAVAVVTVAQDAPQAAGAPQPAGPRFAEGTSVVILGEITSQPSGIIDEDKMQVAVGPAKMDFTLHLSEAKMYSYHGTPVDEDHLVDKMWVRAEGRVMDDPRRIRVSKLQVVGKDMASLRSSPFYRPNFAQGYVTAVAGSRQIFPEMRGAVFTPAAVVIVGKISGDTGALETTRKVHVDAAGNTWTLHVPQDAPVLSAKGEKISVHEVSEGQWVRVHGWQTDDLRVRVARMENVGPEEAYRASTYFRTAEPIGYVERVPGTGVQFNPLKVTGVITAIDEKNGTFTLRDDQGKERVISIETVMISANGQPVEAKGLKQGQRVTVEGSDIVF
jgi:hypothetical protein